MGESTLMNDEVLTGVQLADATHATNGRSQTAEVEPKFTEPPALIAEHTSQIEPQMLPLIALTQQQIDVIVAAVPGGARNVQDIYPLTPLQEGMLFHHLLDEHRDTYILSTVFEIESRARADALIAGLQRVINRHDALRTAVLWEGLSQPVQVVQRHCILPVTETTLNADRDCSAQLREWLIRLAQGMDLRKAPLMRLLVAAAPNSERCFVLLQRHHIVFDHQSWSIAFKEAMTCMRGREGELSVPPQYRTYVAWSLTHASVADAESYFRRKLGDFDEPAAPFGIVDSDAAAEQLGQAQIMLTTSLAQRVRVRARALSVPVSRLFHAAWALVIAGTSRRGDVVFGTIVLGAHRRHPHVRSMVGLFVNTLPVRLNVSDTTAMELVERTHRELGDLLQHQQASPALTLRCSSVDTGVPLFTAVLNYRHSAGHSVVDPGAACEGYKVLAHEYRTNFPIMLVVDDLGEGFALTAQTDPRIDPQQIAGYALSALESLVDALESAPATRADALSILPPDERRQVIEGFNATHTGYPMDRLVHELFEEQARRTPTAAAVTYCTQSLTYAKLNRSADRLARHLRQREAGAGQLVAICMERGVDMVVGLLGSLKAGAAYLPLDPNYPAERLQYMLQDAQPRVVLTQESLRSRLPATQADLVLLDVLLPQIEEEDRGDPQPAAWQSSLDDLVYVIYTSGTTGRPKGTAMPHRAMVNLIEWHRQCLPPGAGGRVLQFAALSFDVAFQEIFSTLCTGGELVMLDEWVRRDARALMELLSTHSIQRLFIPPMMLQALAEHFRSSPSAPRSLRDVITAGEQLRVSPDIVQLFEQLPGCRLHNHYGPTETHVVTALTLEGEARHWPAFPTIGRPIANTQIYILDAQHRPVPRGALGEIYIAGANVAHGYLNRPELTADRFLRDPFRPGARMYKTGDLGRWQADGTIEYLGRNDHQVKIRGFRVELGEIEAQLATHAQIREASVVAREDAPGEKRLVAYVTTRESTAPGVEALRSHLQRLLPDYMIPSAFVVLNALPLTPSGKLDRRALPAPQAEAFVTRGYGEPQTEAEAVIAAIWQGLLRVERVGRHDNFFELGGHSLLLVQMMERLRRVGFKVDVRSLYESRTLADLALTLTGSADQLDVPPNRIPAMAEQITPDMLPLVQLDAAQIATIEQHVPGGARNIQDIYPLAPLQDGILFHHLYAERSADPYVVSMLFALPSHERLADLIGALQCVIDRHDILRTAVLWEQLPQAVQVVHRSATLPVEQLTLTTERDALEQLKDRMRPEHQLLDVRRAPLMQLQVASDAGAGQHYAILELHHLACDHESLDTMLMEVIAGLNGHAAELPLPVPYRNHVAQALAHARSMDAAAFFRDKIGDVTEPTAPFGLQRVHGDVSRVDRIEQLLEPALAQRVRQQAQRLSVSAATLFHAVWALVVSRTSARDDVVFGTVLLGRLQSSAGAQRVLGLFMNTLPFRLKLHGLACKQLVERTQREIVDLLCYEQASLAVAQRCSGIAGPTPLFTALLNYRWGTVGLQSEFAAAGVARLAVESYTNYPLALSVLDQGGGFLLDMQTRHVEASRILCYVITALESLVDALEYDPHRLVQTLEILPQYEREQVIGAFNATRAEYPRDRLIHELFEDQVQRSPDAVALICDRESLTYAQLNGRANQLARYLLAQGVRPGDYIPILLPRSTAMLIALLAVLKAGAVYVPVDPDVPSERLAFMLQDCDAACVIGSHVCTSELAERVRWIDYERIAALLESYSADNPHTQLPIGSAAYVMYTSGSTGVPKGVIVQHHAVNRLVINNGYAPIGANDCIAHYSNPAFDASTFEVWGPLLTGGRVLIVPQHVVLDAPAFAALLESQRVTLLYMSVGLFNQYAHVLDSVFARLRYLIVGGDTLEIAAVKRVLRRSPPQYLLNGYGPTECTTFTTTHLVRELADDATSIPIGRPMANAQTYILDAYRQPVPIGVPGELYIGGSGVALGYLKRPELTAERFVANPYSSDPRARLYRTGDLARWRADGVIEFLGRNDHQVKIRGFRIELGEIEAHLCRDGRVEDAAVLAREDVPGEKRLVAYLVLRERPHTAAQVVESLREHLRAAMPEYMIPGAFVVLERLPLTSNGKLDRRALPAPEADDYASQEYEPPQGELETLLARMWTQLLGVACIGRQDDFFQLGGHSLSALRLLFTVNQAFGATLRVADVYRNPRLGELAARIRGEGMQDDRVDLSREAILDDGTIAAPPQTPCKPAQRILLTGCTGFVGRFLLVRLIEDTNATIYCLVRAPSPQHASERLKATLLRWDLWRDRFEQRIVAIPGDLRLPRLGMREPTYDLICRTVDSIYHCATSMNHLETYPMAKAANVGSARELLRLAITERSKQVNYVSTLAVFGPSAETARVVDEMSSIDREVHSIASGYAASKWVAEKIFMTAAERAIPCNIFRLGLVWADSQQGRYDELQREYRLVKSCLLSGCGIENYRYRMAPTPVDYVARSIAFLSERHPKGGGIFHVSATQQPNSGVFERYREQLRAPLVLLPHYQWVREMKRRHDAGQSLPIVPLIDHAFSMSEESFYEQERSRRAMRARFECARTHRELLAGGIVAPPLSDDLLGRSLDWMLSRDPDLRDLVDPTGCDDLVGPGWPVSASQGSDARAGRSF
jgi:amino acid adenylation domain-containing protein/thioester reductase-like protein